MLIIISPAKSLDFNKSSNIQASSKPDFQKEATQIIKALKDLSPKEIGELMHISHDLSTLNYHRFQNWKQTPTKSPTKQALFAFTGEVFRGLKTDELSKDDLLYTQDHLRILSGLYGTLRPLDSIQPYRLEMSTKIKFEEYKNLYQFWDDKITKKINTALDESKTIINLASHEYFKSLKRPKLKANIITPIFKDFSKGELKVIVMYAKNARGAMSNFIIKNRIENPEEIKAFDNNGYSFDANSSDDNNWVFIR